MFRLHVITSWGKLRTKKTKKLRGYNYDNVHVPPVLGENMTGLMTKYTSANIIFP